MSGRPVGPIPRGDNNAISEGSIRNEDRLLSNTTQNYNPVLDKTDQALDTQEYGPGLQKVRAMVYR